MKTEHRVDQSRWATLTIFEQMGNIYSEVGRSFNAKKRNNDADRLQATARAIDLFDATTAALVAKKSPKSKEVLRAKEEYLEVINSDTMSSSEIQGLDRYFMQFAVAARLNR